MKILKHEKSGKPASIQVDLQFFVKVNIAAVIDLIQDTKFYWKGVTIQIKKQKFCVKS